MTVLGINYACGIVQVLSGGKKYTCPMKEESGQLYFRFMGQWHNVKEYASDSLRESGYRGLGQSQYYHPSRDSISQKEFEQIVDEVLRNNPDVESYRYMDMGVRITLISNSGKSTWCTTLNFNDGGRITGRYTYTQAYEGAALPWVIGNRISGLIKNALCD